MELLVKDILNMPIMKNHRIVAGYNGINNTVTYPSVFDGVEVGQDYRPFDVKNNFFITSFINNEPSYILKAVKAFVEAEVSGLCIIDMHINDIPQNVKDFCDAKNFPVIFLDEKIPYSHLLSAILQKRVALEDTKLLERQIDDLRVHKLSEKETKYTLDNLNANFLNKCVVFYALKRNVDESTDEHDLFSIASIFNPVINAFTCEYHEGILYIHSFDEQISDEEMERIRGRFDELMPNSTIGISRVHDIFDLGLGVKEALTCVQSETKNKVVHYQDLGTARLLIELEDHPAIDAFYEEIMGPILKNKQLFATVKALMENEMDYKKASKSMKVHENTIRYRVGKIKELINYGSSEIDFLETLSIAYKIYKLKENK
ncbi:MAG: PucR family transcriptional regulator [Clostridia bacterium]|nr:PucR family transcriptional regulator [Clostridia bacterium]